MSLSRLLVLASVILLGACTDYSIPLVNDYELARISGGGNFMIVDPDKYADIAGPRVEEYAVIGEIVVGRVGPAEGERAQEPIGYFAVDTRSGESSAGLSRKDWLALLETLDIYEAPDLVRPNRFHVWFSP